MNEKDIDTIQALLSPDESKADRLERIRQIDEARKLIRLPISEWPEFDVLWNLNPIDFRYSLDGCSVDDFISYYPDGMILSEVSLSELDMQLCKFNQRSAEEVWDVGFDDKAARVLLSWIEGRAITPPLVGRTNITDELCLHGGNHRLAVARAKGETRLPILISPSNYQFVADSLSLLSISKQ